ncbi:HAMP domain-containing sensor histidine kinase [Streptomyces sp. TRM 70361]|uniref:sensor histidine kinase n=1 Tax=Streptomyces sp. TRM 70361 TaxID=3116553 RepID=UPI002E7BD8A2|nr:HAMP domain-containing sensor histidine kinase [Streptomyces sp. TRM 70361]MEE1937950.1 HAMP domain-containing sensor histidine kinase [Streptomyces sp. TRM 70361]
MRWALVKVCIAVTAMVVVAFAVPLALVVKEMARDRAFSNAERLAATVMPALAITGDRDELERALATTPTGLDGRIAVYAAPGRDGGAGEEPGDGAGGESGDRTDDAAGDVAEVGTRRVSEEELRTAAPLEGATVLAAEGGHVLLQPVVTTAGTAVVEVFVPEQEVTNGVATAWLVLAGTGAALIVASVVIADRLGTRMVGAAERLARAARELGAGRLAVRVPVEGPAELRLAAAAFNSMADQVAQLLANERELAADLSHRLRTPLTVLRLNTASLGDGDAAEQTREAVDKLEREVDHIIRTAREHRTQPPGGPGGGAVCDASEVIRERMGFWSALAEDEGREVRLAGVDRPVHVPVARADLVAALDALLGNVFRHTPEGTAFAVDVHHGEAAGDSVIVLVSDAGPGIDDPDAALRRGHGDGGPGSTGLGLDIVRRVAEATGGDLRIGRSVLGGTEVRLWLALDGGAAGGSAGRTAGRRGHRVRRRARR